MMFKSPVKIKAVNVFAPITKISVFSFFAILLLSYGFELKAQTPGLIFKPASTALGRAVLDPNGDGYTSVSSSGFSGTDYGSASELQMVSVPLMLAEPTADLSTGASGGHTEIVSLNGSNSVMVLKKTVSGIPIFIDRSLLCLSDGI